MSRIAGAPKAEDFDLAEIQKRAHCMRKHILRMVHAAKSGHPGGSLSAADIMACLYFGGALSYDPEDPQNPDRDRFVLSKGHAAPVLYAALHEVGYIPDEWLDTLRHLNSKLQGHPDMLKCPGVEASTGSLGQGLSIASGIALGLAQEDRQSGKELRHVFVMTGDGELQEGQNWEALMYAAYKKINNLVAIVDHNRLQIDGFLDDVLSLGDLNAKFEAFGWKTFVINGHDINAIQEALLAAKAYEEGPVVILCNTIKGKGISYMEDQAGWHGKAPNDDEYKTALSELL